MYDIYEKVIKPVDWGARAEEIGQRVYAALESFDKEMAKNYQPNIAAERDRIRERTTKVRQQLEGNLMLKALATKGNVEIGTSPWAPQLENAEGKELQADGRNCLYLKATAENANGSWRLTVNAPPGKYRLEGIVKVRSVQVSANGGSNEGGGVRISGGTRTTGLHGSTDWNRIFYDFAGTGGDQVLVIELRAKSGEMWIDRGSLRLVKVQ
jgi:hypothetical protein